MKVEIKRIVPEKVFQPFELKMVFDTEREAMLFRHLIGCHGGRCVESENVREMKEELSDKMHVAGFPAF